MKKINKSLFFGIIACILTACGYDEVAYEEEVAQQLYLPAATYNIYEVKDSAKNYAVPTPGKQKRYILTADKMIIPLSVYRSGLNTKGSAAVNIEINNDTIVQMINKGLLSNAVPLPLSAMSVPSSVVVPDGEDIGKLELQVDLMLLTQNPENRYATAITISSNERLVTPNLKTAIIVIDADLAGKP